MYKIGDIITAKVTNIRSYGFFVTFDSKNGLVHISEISDSYIDSINRIVSKNEIVKLKIIDIKDDKYFLSFKACHSRYNQQLRTILVENDTHSDIIKHFTEKEIQKYKLEED